MQEAQRLYNEKVSTKKLTKPLLTLSVDEPSKHKTSKNEDKGHKPGNGSSGMRTPPLNMCAYTFAGNAKAKDSPPATPENNEIPSKTPSPSPKAKKENNESINCKY